ncbi:MAG: DUF3796 domain-containing protein [Methanomicrobia archaeon]|nr:DUF3796 domain-containing protein [Methanomicrobia archaeon]
MKNALWYLGFLSIFSLLFLVEGKPAFLGFLGFLPYFSLYNIRDERLEINIGKATRNAFMYMMFFGTGTIVCVYLLHDPDLLAPAFPMLFGGSLLTCILSVLYYERTGK